MIESVSKSVFSHALLIQDGCIYFLQTGIYGSFSIFDLLMYFKTGIQIFLFCYFETHHHLILRRHSVHSKTGRVWSTVFEGLKHRSHFFSNASRFSPMNDSCYTAHFNFIFKVILKAIYRWRMNIK